MTTQNNIDFYCKDIDNHCNEQCFDCMADIGEQRIRTKSLTGKADDSPARQAYLNWVAKGKPEHPLINIKL